MILADVTVKTIVEHFWGDRPLMQLIANGIIPWNQADFLVTMGISESEFDAMLQHMENDANPFETWMLANGYSQEIIDQIYGILIISYQRQH